MLNLKLTYFGAFQLEVNGQPVTNFRTDKTAALLAYLLLEGQTPKPRSFFTDFLWHGYEKKAANTSLRVALSHLRHILAPLTPIRATSKHIQLDSTNLVIWSDAGAILEIAGPHAEQFSAQQISERLALYRGQFLQGWETLDSIPFQAWLKQQRTYFQTVAVKLRPLTLLPNTPLRPYQHNLPWRTTPLFGHATTVAELRTLLLDPQQPLITLIGEGGIGKTRLALAAANTLLPTAAPDQRTPFIDGLWFVPLTDLTPTADLPDQLAAAIGIACGYNFTGPTPLMTQLITWLQNKSLLLILDSFEHLITASNWLNTIIQAAPGVKFLVTSRQRLNLQAAMIYPIHELATPALDQAFTEEELLTYPSIQLFVERGQRVRAGFRLRRDNAAAIVQICRQMAGLPLGIELAATLLLLYTPAQIAEQLAVDALSVRAEWLDWPARHQTLEEVLKASWRLLSQDEAKLLAHLAVIQGDFTQETATTIGEAPPATLFKLVDKSLLRQSVEAARFTMHDRVRDYALHQLQQQPACEKTARRRHAAYYLALVEAEEAALPNTYAAQQRLLSRLDNIRVAWAWSIEQGEVALWTKASDSLIWFYRIVGYAQEASTALGLAATALRAALEATPDNVHYQALLARLLASIVEFNPYVEWEQLLPEALYWSECSGEPHSRSMVYMMMARQALIRGDFKSSSAYTQQAYHWAEQSGQVQDQLASLNSLAVAYYFQGAFTLTQTTLDELWDKLKRTRNRYVESPILINLGHFYTDTDNFGQALCCLRQAMISAWQVRPASLYDARLRLGKLYSELGFFDIAQNLYRYSLTDLEHTPNFYSQTIIHNGIGVIGYVTGDLALARQHFTAALHLTRQHKIPYWEHLVLIDFGYALADHDPDQAATCFEQALHLGEPWQKYSTLARAYVGLARVALRRHQPQQAAAAVEQALTYWDQGRTSHAEPRRFYWHCYEVLRALDDPRAETILQQGYTLVRQTAETLTDPFLRRSFLENVPLNRALLTAVEGGQPRTNWDQ